MVNKMTGETDTSYELHFEYAYDAEKVAEVIGLAAGPPVEKDEGPGGWRGWVVTVPKRVHHRSEMWGRCMEVSREGSFGMGRIGEREKDMRERERDLRDLRDMEREPRGMRDVGRGRDRSVGRDMGRERERSMVRDRSLGRDVRDVDFRRGERRSMIPVPIQRAHPEPPRLNFRRSQKFRD